MNFTVYSKDNCPYCYKVKQVLELTNSNYVVYNLGEDFTKEEFYAEFGKGSTSSRNINSSENNLNKSEDHRNRGVDFILNGGKRKQTQPFHIIFEKMVCFLNREVTIYFEFSLKSRKRKVISRRKRNVSS
jgi:glutaredoxin